MHNFLKLKLKYWWPQNHWTIHEFTDHRVPEGFTASHIWCPPWWHHQIQKVCKVHHHVFSVGWKTKIINLELHLYYSYFECYKQYESEKNKFASTICMMSSFTVQYNICIYTYYKIYCVFSFYMFTYLETTINQLFETKSNKMCFIQIFIHLK
jgi:hypothetical protein